MRATATSLNDVIGGPVVVAGDPTWDRARQAFNLSVDQRPVAVAFPHDERDVVAIVDHAREHGLRIAPQSTGHGAAPLGPLDEVVLVNLSRLDDIAIDPDSRRVRVGAGVTWGQIVPQLSELGLAALHGSSPGVGVVGYSLSGGMGWLARQHGLQADSVTAIEVVTAQGQLVRADAAREPQLFWALRGGGGSFGVVTAIEFAVHPVRELYAGAMFFALEQAPAVLHAWTEQLPALPDRVTSWASLLRLPDASHLPAAIRGRSLTAVLGAFLGSEHEGRALLGPLRELGPQLDTFAMVPPVALAGLAMDPPHPVPYTSIHHLLGDLPAEGIDDLVAAAGTASGSTLAKVQLRHTGGALRRTAPGAGALAEVPGTLSLFALGVVENAESRASVASSIEKLDAAVRGYSVGDYASFVDHPTDARRFFAPHTWTRLREVKALYDPDDLFLANHHVPPAEPGQRSHVPSLHLGPTHVEPVGEEQPSAVVRSVEAFRWNPAVALFEGTWDGIETSVYVTTFDGGEGPGLHRHPYPEVFLVQHGQARFHVGEEHRDVAQGHFVVVAAETWHRYENIGPDPLTVISVHPNGVVVQTNRHDAA